MNKEIPTKPKRKVEIVIKIKVKLFLLNILVLFTNNSKKKNAVPATDPNNADLEELIIIE